MGPEVLLGIAARLVVAGWRDVVDIDRAIKSAADKFRGDPDAQGATGSRDVPGVETALERWVGSDEFKDLFHLAQIGERDFAAEEVISSFITEGDFYMPSRAESERLAEEIVSVFLGELLSEIYQSKWGISALANRGEELAAHGRQQRNQILTGVEALRADMGFLVAKATASAGSDKASGDTTGPHSDAKAEIDLARQLIDLGQVRSAREKLESVRAKSSLSVDLEFRVVTNLGACAIAEGDYESACLFFDEAHELQPDNPKGITNVSVAARLRGDAERALDLAHRALELEPRNGHAAAIIIESFWEAEEREQLREFITSHAWVTADRSSGLVLADVRAKQGRFEEAAQLCQTLIEDDPKDIGAHLMLSQCLFTEAQASLAKGGAAENTAHERLKQCEEAASRAIELLDSTDLDSQLSSALVVRGFAKALQGHIDAALSDLDDAVRADPRDPSPLHVRGLVLMMAGRYDDARDSLEQVWTDIGSEDVIAPLAEVYLRLGDHLAAKKLIRGKFTFENPGPDDLWKAELVCQVDMETDDEDPAWRSLEESLLKRPEDPWLLAVSATRRRSLRDFVRAEEDLQKALSFSDDSGRPEILFRLGNFYWEMKRFSDAADAYAKVVDDSPLHLLAVDLLGCLAEARRLREALEWSRQIRKTRVEVPKHVIDTEAQILEIVGDLPPAVALREQICARPDVNESDRVRLALLQFRAGLRDAARKTVESLEPSDLQGDPRLLLELAKLKVMLGVDGALNDAYAARRHGIDDPDLHSGYFAIFLAHDHEMAEPELVAPGCAVRLRDTLTGEETWWSILDDEDERYDTSELPANHKFARRLIGSAVGDKIEMRDDLEELTYRVVAIQNKFVRAFQETIAEFSTRFPDNTSLSRIVADEGDITKLIQATERRAQFVRSVEERYREGGFPFAMFSSLIGPSPVEVWRACTVDGSVPIRFAMGDPREADLAQALLPGTQGIVLDLPAVLTVHELGIGDQLKARFGCVAVPQHVVDEFQATNTMAKTMRASGHLGKSDDGRYVFSERHDEGLAAWRDFAQSVLEFVESLERVPAYQVLDLGDAEFAVEALTISGVGAICSDMKLDGTPLVMVSDDVALANLVRATGKEVVNSQGVLEELLRSGALEAEEYSAAVGQLASMHYTFLRLGADDILRRLKANGYISNEETRAMLGTLRGPDSDPRTAVAVVTGLISRVFDRVPLSQLGMILELSMDVLCQGRTTLGTLTRLKDSLEADSKLALSPFEREFVLSRVRTQLDIHSNELA